MGERNPEACSEEVTLRTVPFKSNTPRQSSLSSLLHISAGTKSRFPRDIVGLVAERGTVVIGRYYFTHRASTLLKFAQSTTNPQLAAVLVEKAAALKSQLDESNARPDLSQLAPDVERETSPLPSDIRPQT
jgi:hypothetical protein